MASTAAALRGVAHFGLSFYKWVFQSERLSSLHPIQVNRREQGVSSLNHAVQRHLWLGFNMSIKSGVATTKSKS
jgi:hypothetical protein